MHWNEYKCRQLKSYIFRIHVACSAKYNDAIRKTAKHKMTIKEKKLRKIKRRCQLRNQTKLKSKTKKSKVYWTFSEEISASSSGNGIHCF